MADSFPKPPQTLSEFQRKRLSKAFHVVKLYLNKGMNVERIAGELHCKHQRVSQVLKLGIDYLVETGIIRAVEKLAA